MTTVDPQAFPEPSLTGPSLSGIESEEDTTAFETALAASFETDETPAEDPSDEDVEPEDGEEGEPPSGEPPTPGEGEEPPPPAEAIRLGEHEIPADRAEALGQFYAWAQTDEGSAWVQFLGSLTEAGLSPSQVAAFLKPQGEPGGTAAPPAPEDDFADPELKALREQVAAQNQALEQLQHRVQSNAVSNMQAVIAKATNDFVASHGLTNEDMAKVRDYTEARNLVAGFAGADAHSTLMQAFETAYWAMPDFREREMNRREEQRKIEAKKNRKLAAIGGTNGSTPAKSKSAKPEEVHDAIVAELAEHMGFPSRTG